MALAVVNVGVLIYFIHHVSTSIHADRAIAAVYHELSEHIQRLFPEESGYEFVQIRNDGNGPNQQKTDIITSVRSPLRKAVIYKLLIATIY